MQKFEPIPGAVYNFVCYLFANMVFIYNNTLGFCLCFKAKGHGTRMTSEQSLKWWGFLQDGGALFYVISRTLFCITYLRFLTECAPIYRNKIDMNNELKLGHMFYHNMKYRCFHKISTQMKNITLFRILRSSLHSTEYLIEIKHLFLPLCDSIFVGYDLEYNTHSLNCGWNNRRQ